MKTTELRQVLEAHPGLTVSLILPGGDLAPAHFHVTEVGHVVKRFVDCGGTFRVAECCLLQIHVGSPRDDGHRLTAGKLARIFHLAQPLLASADLPLEVEYEDAVTAQYPLTAAVVAGDTLNMQLGWKHTDCLAKDQCGQEAGSGTDAEPAASGCGCATTAAGGCC
jgi:hypothetical protein